MLQKPDQEKKTVGKITYPPPADALFVVKSCKPAGWCKPSCRPRRIWARAGRWQLHAVKENERLCNAVRPTGRCGGTGRPCLEPANSVRGWRKNTRFPGFSFSDTVIFVRARRTRNRAPIWLEPPAGGAQRFTGIAERFTAPYRSPATCEEARPRSSSAQILWPPRGSGCARGGL